MAAVLEREELPVRPEGAAERLTSRRGRLESAFVVAVVVAVQAAWVAAFAYLAYRFFST